MWIFRPLCPSFFFGPDLGTLFPDQKPTKETTKKAGNLLAAGTQLAEATTGRTTLTRDWLVTGKKSTADNRRFQCPHDAAILYWLLDFPLYRVILARKWYERSVVCIVMLSRNDLKIATFACRAVLQWCPFFASTGSHSTKWLRYPSKLNMLFSFMLLFLSHDRLKLDETDKSNNRYWKNRLVTDKKSTASPFLATQWCIFFWPLHSPLY
jgi:hypothetical protein